MANMQAFRTPLKVQKAEIRKQNFNSVFSIYTPEEAMNEASRCLHCPKPKCKEYCPIHNNIPEFLEAVKDGNFKLAYELIKVNSNLPAICGTVCPHENQCEGHCVRGIKSESVGIGAVERFIADWAEKEGLTNFEVTPNGHSVCAIGSGPASLAFALEMAEQGFQVDIYEKQNYIGGILKWGIPSYRLEKEATDRYINRLLNLGTKFITNYKVGKDHPLQELIDMYEGVFIGIGAPNATLMHHGNEFSKVIPADKFLESINTSPLTKDGKRLYPFCGEKVIIVGGGNVAMDAARDAVRLPQVKEVSIVYRRTIDEMPACTEELNHAKEEGIKFITLTNPCNVIGHHDEITAVECQVMELGEPDSSGRRRPIDSGKPHIYLEADTVVPAFGFNNDPEIAATTKGLEADDWGCFKVDENNETTIKNVYAGGDAVTGAQTVVLAMKAGLNAARHLSNKLKGE